MPIEIRELVIKAIVAPDNVGDKNPNPKEKKQKVQTAQDTLNMVNYILKNEKER